MHKKSAPGPLGRERLDIGGLGNRLADEDFFGLFAVHADVEAVCRVLYAYALEVVVNSGSSVLSLNGFDAGGSGSEFNFNLGNACCSGCFEIKVSYYAGFRSSPNFSGVVPSANGSSRESSPGRPVCEGNLLERVGCIDAERHLVTGVNAKGIIRGEETAGIVCAFFLGKID